MNSSEMLKLAKTLSNKGFKVKTDGSSLYLHRGPYFEVDVLPSAYRDKMEVRYSHWFNGRSWSQITEGLHETEGAILDFWDGFNQR